MLRRAQAESEQLISELKRHRNDGLKEHELHAMRAKLQDAIDANSEKIAAAKPEDDAVPTDLKPGDTVLLDLNARATVLTAPDGKGDCSVQAGALKLKANVSRMRRAKPEKEKKPKGGAKVSVSMRDVETECDVRGNTLEEALMAVDLFLDGAVLNRLREVSIIHGKGTGVLRAGIHKHLKGHPAVKEFRLGRYGEGEDGVTIVTLK